MSGRTPIPTGPTPKVKASQRLADNVTAAASDIEDPWKLIGPPQELQSRAQPSVALPPDALSTVLVPMAIN